MATKVRARCRHSPIADPQHLDHLRDVERVADADQPRSALGTATADLRVASRLHVEIGEPSQMQQARSFVDGPALDDPHRIEPSLPIDVEVAAARLPRLFGQLHDHPHLGADLGALEQASIPQRGLTRLFERAEALVDLAEQTEDRLEVEGAHAPVHHLDGDRHPHQQSGLLRLSAPRLAQRARQRFDEPLGGDRGSRHEVHFRALDTDDLLLQDRDGEVVYLGGERPVPRILNGRHRSDAVVVDHHLHLYVAPTRVGDVPRVFAVQVDGTVHASDGGRARAGPVEPAGCSAGLSLHEGIRDEGDHRKSRQQQLPHHRARRMSAVVSWMPVAPSGKTGVLSGSCSCP